jgi:MoaF-like
MNKILVKIIGFVFSVLVSANSYAIINLEHYVFHYESGDTYDVKLTDNTITWNGLEGGDKGQSETDYIKRKKFSNDIEVIQWNETSGTFVTLVFDRTHLQIISSLKTSDGEWLMSGKATVS